MFDFREAGLSESDLALCNYAVKLTSTPGQMTGKDVEVLKSHGFDDDAIHIAAQVIGYFNYINRIADGLGVTPEDWMTMNEADWRAKKANLVT